MGYPPLIQQKKALIGATVIAVVVVWLVMNLNISREKAIKAEDIEITTITLSNPHLVTSAIKGSFMVLQGLGYAGFGQGAMSFATNRTCILICLFLLVKYGKTGS